MTIAVSYTYDCPLWELEINRAKICQFQSICKLVEACVVAQGTTFVVSLETEYQFYI